jgi:hypothetical protein
MPDGLAVTFLAIAKKKYFQPFFKSYVNVWPRVRRHEGMVEGRRSCPSRIIMAGDNLSEFCRTKRLSYRSEQTYGESFRRVGSFLRPGFLCSNSFSFLFVRLCDVQSFVSACTRDHVERKFALLDSLVSFDSSVSLRAAHWQPEIENENKKKKKKNLFHYFVGLVPKRSSI